MIIFLIATFILIVVIFVSLKSVADYERLLIFRFGKPIGIKGPGKVLVLPWVDTCMRVEVDYTPPLVKSKKDVVSVEEADKALMAYLLKKRGLTDSEITKNGGTVVVDGIKWEAFSTGWIQSAAPIVVIGVESLRLKVTRT